MGPMAKPIRQALKYTHPDYEAARLALQQEEQQQAFDFAFKQDQSALEVQANKIFERIRITEHERILSVSGPEADKKFYSALSAIETSDLMRIARRAPKGALLHCHFDAMLPPETMIPVAQEMHNMHIRCTVPLATPCSFVEALPEMRLLTQTEAAAMSHVNIFHEDYSLETWMPYRNFRQQFPTGEQAADKWLVSKILLQKHDAYSPERTNLETSIWKCMNNSMRINRGLLRYERAWREYIRRIIWNLAEDGICYAEIRFAMHYGSTVTTDNGERTLSHEEMLEIVQEVLQQEKEKLGRREILFYGIKIIYANLRGCTQWEMKWCIDDVIHLKQRYPDLICGFDLCGQEDAGKPLSFWVSDLVDMQKQCQKLGLDIPFILHAGETLDDGGEADSNLYDAVLLGTKRIGHGYSLLKHPFLIEICKERNIAIEICPTSNELLGLCEQIQAHPVYALLARSVPCTINTDDPGFWGYLETFYYPVAYYVTTTNQYYRSSSSHELYQLTIGSRKISLPGWKRLAEWSFDYSCMDEDEKICRQKRFQEDWQLFCTWIVENFPDVKQDEGDAS
ncbi:hypothetical protein N7510_006662 [Penicillium lagena]|uniref:uncharacterized protein n=1 Tax=Penicillium lagena TaxID=94218 RepID=UPI00253FAFB6|nr:uncharacterized protein N7510_006662 [Penicillium lagena]KAJ5609943.1 hypothetical protein N7510_006662 [Penicillium lagena]